MQNVKFKSSSIIYSFITAMIVIFLLNVVCDLRYINDKKIEINESMKYEDRLNMFLSNLRSKGKGEYKDKFSLYFEGEAMLCLLYVCVKKRKEKKRKS